MLARIAAFELRYQMRSPLFLISWALFFFMTFATVVSPYFHLGVAGNHNVNSPFAILQKVMAMNLFAVFIVTAFVASVAVRDRETLFAPILFATPLRKGAYLVGRFTGAMVVALLLMTAVPLAVMAGSFMPWLDPQRVGPFVPAHYLYALFVVAAPVLLALGASFFALATATRSMMWTYVGVVAFFLLYLTVSSLLRDPAWDSITAILDPFGFGALSIETKYWTLADRNTLLPPLTGVLLVNRLIWLSVAGAMFALAFALFRFEVRGAALHRMPGATTEEAAPHLPSRTWQAAGSGRAWAAFGSLMRFEMNHLLRSPAFYVLLAVGMLITFVDIDANTNRLGVPYLPATSTIVRELQDGFTITPWLIALYYASELLWREREHRVHEIVDASAVPSWTILLPKILAIAVVLLATLLAGAVMGMLYQLAHGYGQVEPLHYLLWFVLPEAVFACLLAVFAVSVQSLVPHKAIGWAVMMLLLAIILTLPSFGFEHGLYRYAYTPPVPLSAMNGMDRFWIARAWFDLYWCAFATVLMVLALLLWRRGTQTRLLPRLLLGTGRRHGSSPARQRCGWPPASSSTTTPTS
jgi:ABC-type transport system involved in multi-copper enzyme maturation permease subunit